MKPKKAYTARQIERAFQKAASLIPYRLPGATYRLQFNRFFHFRDAARIIPYLKELGITDVYASPFFLAKPGSMHGYDLTDYDRLNPEIGTDEEFEAYVAELRRYGMGQLLDIVPNHMSIGDPANRWWQDVLENGQSSPCAAYFDIDWKPAKEELEDKILLPILGDQYGRILENGELRLSLVDGGFQVNYYEQRLPLDPKSYARILEPELESLAKVLGAENEDHQELLSIITALGHLPARTAGDPEKVAERRREKEVIKRRLADLYGRNPQVRNFINARIRKLNGSKGSPSSFDDLDNLLSDQAYRLAYWRVATQEINYRRFFDINDLAAVRMENPEVFQDAHGLVLKWIRQGKITSLRIDHPDGLQNPTAYFRKLQEECFLQLCLAALAADSDPEEEALEACRRLYHRNLYLESGEPLKKPFYLVGEKIVMDGETMPPFWPIFGATGYVFMNTVNGVFIDRAKARAMSRIYSRFSGENRSFAELLRQSKILIMQTSMASEINGLGHSLNRISENDRYYRDFTLNSLTQAIVETIAYFPIYRTYIDARGVPARDRHYLDAAIAKARRASREVSVPVFAFLRDVLLQRYPEHPNEAVRQQCLSFTMKFQQLTGPVMAKGMEDTSFYIYNRFVSLNEVGGNPEKFGITVDSFHAANIDKLESWPHTLSATSTHDSKRGEDVRARLNVLSEIPDQWQEHLRRWSRINRRHKKRLDGTPFPDRNAEYLLYQTLVGAWPPAAMDEGLAASFKGRIVQYMLKAAREAKTHTSWLNQSNEYEEALTSFIDNILQSRNFLADFLPFVQLLARYGIFNSLAQTLLKITSPGIPDFYQGTELLTFTLVDPDNRSPVDYEARAAMLASLKEKEGTAGTLALVRDLTDNPADGGIKLYLIYKALHCRLHHLELFRSGEYVPLQVAGPLTGKIVSYLRRNGNEAVLVVVPRLLTSLGLGPDALPLGEIWQDNLLILPEQMGERNFSNILTGETILPVVRESQPALRLSEVLSRFPVALLTIP
jgi:(1->4)-alpha-D-glucan 1-alpha-D-glucosylmutase